jgi:prepilin-type processing-associated H-X9-DG protein
VVFSNTDPDPEDNFVSVNALFLKAAGAPLQPGLPDADWAMLMRSKAKPAWAIRRTAGSADGFTPILEIDYEGGRSQGMGYVEFWMGAPKPVSGPAAVREVFTVTGPARRVGAVAVRVRRLAGSAPLAIRLERGDGKVLAVADGQGPLPACTPSATLGGCDWVSVAFPAPLTLEPGLSYHLVLTAPAAARYEAFPMRKGTDKGFSAATLFADGHAEYSDGSGWAGWEQWGKGGLTNSDLQFYFRLAP